MQALACVHPQPSITSPPSTLLDLLVTPPPTPLPRCCGPRATRSCLSGSRSTRTPRGSGYTWTCTAAGRTSRWGSWGRGTARAGRGRGQRGPAKMIRNENQSVCGEEYGEGLGENGLGRAGIKPQWDGRCAAYEGGALGAEGVHIGLLLGLGTVGQSKEVAGGWPGPAVAWSKGNEQVHCSGWLVY